MPVNHVQIQNALRLKTLSLSLVSTTAFARSTVATYTDINGVLQTAGINVVRSAHYVNGVLQPAVVESASTNLCRQSENFAATWNSVGFATPTITSAFDITSGVSLDLVGDADGAAFAAYAQTIPFTGDGTKSISFFIKKGTATTSVVRLRQAGVADRMKAVITWVGTVPSVAVSTGTLVSSELMTGNTYRLTFQSSSGLLAAQTNDIQIFPASDSSFTASLTGNILIGGVQAEDATSPTSYIKTTTVAVLRAADIDSMFSATASGYARQTGSFITEGFGEGMEIRETGFASNPVTTITDVADLTLTVRDARAVESAVAGRRVFVGIPTDFAWENIKFSPTQGRPYVEEDYIPGPMDLSSFGAFGNITAEPMYHLNIYVPQNSGIEADGGYADAILTLFAPNTTMVLANGDSVFVRADIAPFMGQRKQIAGNSVIPITIPLRLFTNNAI